MIFHRSACSFLLVLLNTQHHVLADFDSPNFIKGQQSSSTKRDINGRRNMKQDEKGKNDKKNTSTPTYSPSNFPTVTPSIAPYNIITPTMANGPNLSPNCLRNRSSLTPKPSPKPLSFPRTTPFPPPSAKPTAAPTSNPTRIPTQNPTNLPISIDLDTYSPTKDVTFERGDLRKDIRRLGIKVSKGMSVRVVAQANRKLNLGDGNKSTLGFHAAPDGAAIFPLSTGYVYVSNSEIQYNVGGVYGLYFDNKGSVVDYKILLTNTTRNCSGGVTPWRTYVSCEEYANGQCWQVDPDPNGEHHSSPAITMLGGDGGNYEAVACDDRDPVLPIFYVAEDHKFGAVRKYTPSPTGDIANWNSLHADGGTTEYLVFLDDETFTWSMCDDAARISQSMYFPNVEGIDYKDGILYFVSKKKYLLYALDLETNTYSTSRTNSGLLGDGQFKNGPDQIVRNDGEFLYFTEDGGKTPGVYAVNGSGQRYSIFEAYGKKYYGDETTGLAFSPDGKKMYACFQDCGCEVSGSIDCGCLLEFWRDDGRSFDGSTMSLKYHSSE